MTAKGRLLIPLATFVVLLLAAPAMAQQWQPFGPVWDEFGHDFTIFAPAEVSSFDGGPEPATGFFADYRRMYVNVSRPDFAADNSLGDWTWGNRLTGGYMTPENYGWLVEIENVDGPNNVNAANLPALNLAKFNSVEVSRDWRFNPLHEGSIVEGFLGLRYSKFEQWDGTFIDGVPTTGNHIQNNMYGPQAGLRWFFQNDHWILSAEGRYYYAYNDQNFEALNVETGFANHTWVSAGDLRIDATYQLYKAMALSVGWEMLYMGTGVARDLPPATDQAVLVTGVNVGFTINR